MKHASSSHPIELSRRLFERVEVVRLGEIAIVSSGLEPYAGVDVMRLEEDRQTAVSREVFGEAGKC